jgi:hypothetical protein
MVSLFYEFSAYVVIWSIPLAIWYFSEDTWHSLFPMLSRLFDALGHPHNSHNLHIIYAHNSHSSQQKPTGLHV